MSERDQLTQEELIAKNKKTGLMVVLIVAGMVFMSFAFVPLYDLFCRVTGFDGRGIVSDSLPDQILDRTVTIKFNADVSRNLAWNFKPLMREIDVKVGQRGVTAYETKNTSSAPLTGSAVYNVTPLKAGKYFHKIQCFCFNEQLLNPGEAMEMPVVFYVDPSIVDDPNMDDVQTITLSYNFFKTESKELEDALEAFYNADSDI